MGIPDFGSPTEVKYSYEGRGQFDVAVTCYNEVMNSAGSCLFGGFSMPHDALPRLIEAATGWDFKEEDVLRTGKRIITMRHTFNLREGHDPVDSSLPKRCVGEPPLTDGPLKGVTVDHRKLADNFFEHMGWNKETLVPKRESLGELGGLDHVIRDLYR